MSEACDHEWKFNGGNPVCRRCGEYEYPDDPRVVLPATIDADGTVTVHIRGQDNDE